MFSLFLSFAASRLVLGHEEKSFLGWMRANGQYFTGNEYQIRLGIYVSNSRYIAEFNKKDTTFKLGHNKYSCLTPAEYKSLLGNRQEIKPDQKLAKNVVKNLKAPESFDWREKGVVNPIKDQAQCGSCWAFSATCTCESVYAIKTGQLLSFSEQNIVDCVSGCYGCSGGLPSTAIDYVVSRQGGLFNSEEDYPYTALDGTCVFDSSKGIGKVSSYTSVFFHSEIDLLNKVYENGVVSVAIDASLESFHLYDGGIYQDSSCSSWFLDHAVACVGYGSENGTDYWIVRNSWGTTWGEQGYIRMLRGSFTNMCGIASQAIVAVY
ncbi:Cysteine proteinase 3 [Tritrichomonas foetus]|uniref:Cysteine proteinase 3 n=1 Tax=Tritrichomonas foetus TaxID=1144522 RepID=A0A1J4L1C9_9EUKA|nr:Cysteine proteinase 3 [Tritrichomonas foetus]|eukprot:OHT17321.1 Cysteine proteinase 3 [Tritrichomonas foetus]